MIRRYDLRRSDNYLYTGRVSYICSGHGTINVYTGFPVMRATVSWVSYPFAQDEEMSSSSESSSSSLSESISSSESTSSSSKSSFSDSSSSSSSSSFGITSTSSITEIQGLPRLYVSGYTATGFIVTYENIPPQVGYIEFSYNAV